MSDNQLDDIPGDYSTIEGIKERALALENPVMAAIVERAEDRVYYDEGVGGYRIEPPDTDEPDSLEMFFHFGVLTGAALEREYPAAERQERLFDAYVAGFMDSAEGWNGEYPFCQNEEEVRDALQERFEDWIDQS